MNSLYLVASVSLLFQFITNGHSWIEKLEGPRGGGMSRIGMSKNDSVLIRYVCPYEDIEQCQPDPKHGIDLMNLPAGNGDPRRPYRANLASNPKTQTKAGDEILISWAGNGHVSKCCNVLPIIVFNYISLNRL